MRAASLGIALLARHVLCIASLALLPICAQIDQQEFSVTCLLT